MAALRLGLFGGSFNPVHRGHLRLAALARRQLGLDEVWLIPCAESADGKALAPGALRLAWLRQALKGSVGLKAWDGELKRGGVSRTVDTLAELRALLGPEAEFTLLVGADQARRLHTWKRARQVHRLAAIAAFARPGQGRRASPGFGVRWLDTPELDLSSTLIRQRLAQGLGVRRLLPPGLRQDPRLARAYRPKPR